MQSTNSCSPNPSNTHLEVQAKRVGWARHLSLSHDFMGGCSKCLWPQSYQPCGITPFLAEKMPKTISTVITPVDMFFYHQMLNSSNPSSQKHHWCLGSRLVVYGEGTMDFLTGGTLGWGCSPRNSVRRKLWGGIESWPWSTLGRYVWMFHVNLLDGRTWPVLETASILSDSWSDSKEILHLFFGI